MTLPLSPAPRSGARAGGTSRRTPARLSTLRRPAALTALACCGLAACGTTAAPGAGTTHTVTVQPTAPANAAAGSTPTAPASQAAAGPGTCLASDLKGNLTNSQGAAGTFYTDVVLTNTSAASCTLYGYPGVSFVSAPGGSEIGAPADRNTVSPAALVTLAPGGQANFLLALTDVGVYSPAECQPTNVSWLRIYPPGDYGTLYVQDATQTCALTSKVVLRVSTVRAGMTGAGA